MILKKININNIRMVVGTNDYEWCFRDSHVHRHFGEGFILPIATWDPTNCVLKGRLPGFIFFLLLFPIPNVPCNPSLWSKINSTFFYIPFILGGKVVISEEYVLLVNFYWKDDICNFLKLNKTKRSLARKVPRSILILLMLSRTVPGLMYMSCR